MISATHSCRIRLGVTTLLAVAAVQPARGQSPMGIACTLTASGAVSGTTPCQATLISTATGSMLSILAQPGTGSAPPPFTLTAAIGWKTAVTTGQWTDGSVAQSSIAVLRPQSAQAWVETSGTPHQGSMNLAIRSLGTATVMGPSQMWSNVSATLTAQLITPPGVGADGGSVSLTITLGPGSSPKLVAVAPPADSTPVNRAYHGSPPQRRFRVLINGISVGEAVAVSDNLVSHMPDYRLGDQDNLRWVLPSGGDVARLEFTDPHPIQVFTDWYHQHPSQERTVQIEALSVLAPHPTYEVTLFASRVQGVEGNSSDATVKLNAQTTQYKRLP